MYRSRLKGRLDKNVLSYMSSINDDLLLLDYDILGSQAHSIMLYEQKLIKKSELKKILDALATKNINVLNNKITINSFKALPDDFETFKTLYIDGKNLNAAAPIP